MGGDRKTNRLSNLEKWLSAAKLKALLASLRSAFYTFSVTRKSYNSNPSSRRLHRRRYFHLQNSASSTGNLLRFNSINRSRLQLAISWSSGFLSRSDNACSCQRAQEDYDQRAGYFWSPAELQFCDRKGLTINCWNKYFFCGKFKELRGWWST